MSPNQKSFRLRMLRSGLLDSRKPGVIWLSPSQTGRQAAMSSVGLFEAKNRLSALVERAFQREEITIKRHGQPVAMLMPVAGRAGPSEVVKRVRTARKGARLPHGYSIRRLIR